MSWQLIETAPKDGTRVLAWNGITGSYITCYQDKQWPMNGWGKKEGIWYPVPTHWQPLPEPPSDRS